MQDSTVSHLLLRWWSSYWPGSWMLLETRWGAWLSSWYGRLFSWTPCNLLLLLPSTATRPAASCPSTLLWHFYTN